MNLKETKKDLNPEIRKEFEKSKFKVLTNENDFLVKNLKKAGWFIRPKNIFNLPNIKFLLNIQVNSLDTKQINQILVIFF